MVHRSANEKVNTSINIGDVSSCSERESKRGRPPKNENSNRTDESKQNQYNKAVVISENLKEKEIVNVNGGIKRKRGRPRKNEKDNWSIQSEYKEIEEIKTPMVYGSANEKIDERANAGDVGSCTERKRKRGRPPKNENSNGTNENKQNECNEAVIMPENLKEKEIVNVNGEAVDLVALRNADDLLSEELREENRGTGNGGRVIK